MLAAIGVVAIGGRWSSYRGDALIIALLALNVSLTIRDYFGTWAHDDYVRFLYHAPVREVARWLERNPETQDIAIATYPNYFALEPRALRLDLTHAARARFFDSAQALVAEMPLAETTLQATGERVAAQLSARERIAQTPGANIYAAQVSAPDPILHLDADGSFERRLALLGANVARADTIDLDLLWRVESDDLSETLKIFVHVIDTDDAVVAQFDGMGVYPPSMRTGDRFIQFVSLDVPHEMLSQMLSFRVGVYDAASNIRLRLPDGREFIEFPIDR
jgi:hypothetical protein